MKPSSLSPLAFILQYRSIPFNLFFFAYLLLLQPVLTHRMVGVMQRGLIDRPLGVLLLAAPLVELAGLLLKFPAVSLRLKRLGIEPQDSLWTFLVWIFHTVVSVCLLFFALQTFGIDLSETENSLGRNIGFWSMLVVVLKELVILGVWMSLFGPPSKGSNREKPAAAIPVHSAERELLGDALLLIFTALAFTVIWDNFALGLAIDRSRPAAAAASYLGGTFFFLIFFLPVRGIYLFEERLMLRSRLAAAWFSISLVLNLAGALTVIPWR